MATDRVTWSLENAGRSLAFDPSTPGEYLKAAGMTGTGVAPTTVTVAPSVSGGGTFRRSSRKPREIVLPVVTYGQGRDDVQQKLRALVRALDDTYTSPVLVATYPDGTQFVTECHYTGGADQQWGSADTDGRSYCRWVLQLTCPSPYFTSRQVTQAKVGAAAGRGLLEGTSSLSQLRLSGSQALGSVTINNPGDVEAWPVWLIRGPGTSFTAVRAADAATFTFAGNVASGTPVTIDTLTKSVTDSSGANRYGDLSGAPKLFSLPPGASTVQVNLIGADATSLVTLTYQERREVIF